MLNPADADLLFERLIDRIDKPIEYSREISRILADLLLASASSQIQHIEGLAYIFDPVRQKLLSLARPILTAAAHGVAITNRYLATDGVPTAGQQGFYIPRNATITGMWAKSRSTASWVLEARRNGVALTLTSINVIGSASANHQIDLDVSAGDWLQIFASGTGIEHPIAAVELAWRRAS